MAILVFGLIVFLGIHSTRMLFPGLRSRVITKGGSVGAWKWPYTGMSLIGLALIILGYGLARHDPVVLYQPPMGMRHLALLLMLPVFPLIVAAYLRGRIRQRLGHPMLIGTMIWAIAHLSANGSLADVLLFGSFLVWAALTWRALIRDGVRAPQEPVVPWGGRDVIAVAGGLAVYVVFIGGAHAWLFGVSPVS